MNSNTKLFIIFVLGLTIVSLTTWNIAKKKYERISQEEINSVKEVFINKKKSHTESEKAEAKSQENLNEKYGKQVEKLGYTDYLPPPYVISPNEFGENDNYDTVSLIYYANDILTDDHNDPVENADEVVGEDFKQRFGEYEDDSVYIRNDALRTDFEILKDNGEYYSEP